MLIKIEEQAAATTYREAGKFHLLPEGEHRIVQLHSLFLSTRKNTPISSLNFFRPQPFLYKAEPKG